MKIPLQYFLNIQFFREKRHERKSKNENLNIIIDTENNIKEFYVQNTINAIKFENNTIKKLQFKVR